MKSTAVDESLSSVNQQCCSRENQILQTSKFQLVTYVKQFQGWLVQFQLLSSILVTLLDVDAAVLVAIQRYT